MSNTQMPTRRRLLKLLSGAPMLPMASSLSAAAFLTACGGDDDNGQSGSSDTPAPAADATLVSVSFIGMDAPTLANPAEMATTLVKSSMVVKFSDGSEVTYKLAYEPYFITGDVVPDGKGGSIIAGSYWNINNQPIVDNSVPHLARQFFSDSPDGTSLIHLDNATVEGVKGNTVFSVVQFEYNTANQAGDSTYGQLPSPIAVLTLDQDPETGKLTLVKYHNVDTSSVHGLWITCGASLSPWNTHLSSEEYEPDAFNAANSTLKGYSLNTFGDETTANPYNYGHLPEVTVNPDGTGTIKKHYCLGRISHELIQVMPDQRTALMGDDYTNGGLFMFVADQAADLSAGTLYVAKYTGSPEVLSLTGTSGIQWIKLGHATSAEIRALVEGGIKATDIMDVKTADPLDASYTKIFADGKANWVKVVAGKEREAAFLETHRYANVKGASMAFTKMEGTTVSVKDKVAYSALANIQDSMVTGKSNWRSELNVGFAAQIKAGGILKHKLAGGIKDTDGNAIDSEWVPTQSNILIHGTDIAADDLGNTSDPNQIASADNLKFSEKMRTLFIGEDSGNHVNNFLWAYNVDTQNLARIMSIPAGAESTGLHAVDEINGWTYISSNFQHPGDWGSLHAKVKDVLEPYLDASYKEKYGAAVGYITADPVGIKLDKKA